MGATKPNGSDVVVQMHPVQNKEEKTEPGSPPQQQHQPLLNKEDPIPELTKKVLRGPLAPVNNFMNSVEEKVKEFYKRHDVVLRGLAFVLLLTAYLAYLVSACLLDVERARVLIYITVFVFICVVYWIVKKHCGDVINAHLLQPIRTNIVDRHWRAIKWTAVLLFVAFVVFWIIYDTAQDPSRLISLAGLFVYVTIGYLCSTNRSRVKWRPVLWGFALQFVFGLLILRTQVGYDLFKWMGDRVAAFLGFSKAGSDFLFRGRTEFAFAVLPIIVYFSAFTYVIWYLGFIQPVIKKIAWLLQITMGTSPAESFNAAGNIFIGQTEAPLLIRPFLEGMTESELHAVMTGGFATIAGSVLATYIRFGVSAHHLISASFMSAPAALAMSKLMCPEVEEPAVKNADDIKIEKTKEKNLFEAVAVGASMSIGLVANIAVMLIAFLSLLAFVNGLLGWFGSLVGEPSFSFEYICSYVFMPFAYIMGVTWEDSFKVAELLGVKTFLNEFVAYERLGLLARNRANGIGEVLTTRSEIIATYALCGFANFGSMGVQLGGISSLAPGKRGVLATHVLMALIAGTLACFMTACIAGVLYEEGDGGAVSLNTTVITTTALR